LNYFCGQDINEVINSIIGCGCFNGSFVGFNFNCSIVNNIGEWFFNNVNELNVISGIFNCTSNINITSRFAGNCVNDSICVVINEESSDFSCNI
jgi:hypothetical protein